MEETELNLYNRSGESVQEIEPGEERCSIQQIRISYCDSLSSMQGIEEYSSVREVNLSCNQIERIVGLSQLASLACLDLSSNRLTRVEGL